MRSLSFCFPLALLMCGCCGYSTRSLVPSHLRTIGLADVANSTTQPALAEELADSLTSAFSADRSFKVTAPAGADLVLTVNVVSYGRSATSYSSEQEVSAYEISVSAKVDAEDQVRAEQFYTGTTSARFTYDPDITSEEEATSRAVGELARDIVRIVVTAW